MQVQRSTTRRAEAPTSNSRLSALNLYSRPPTEDVGLSEFEEFAFDRLRLLSAIENARAKGLKGDDLKKTIGKARDEYMPVTEEGLRKDYVSHFILRLAYCRSEDLRRWFLQNEVELFKWRFVNNPPSDMNRWLQANGMKYESISGEEQRALKDELTQVLQAAFDEKGGKKYADKDAQERVEHYKVGFEEVLDLVRQRKTLLRGGYAYVPAPDLVSIVANQVRMHLSKQLSTLSRQWPALRENESDRLAGFLEGLAYAHVGEDYSQPRNGGQKVSLAELPALARRSMPLCMSNMYHKLAETHHLKHSARQQFGLFLKGIGLTVDESMAFWRSEFTKRPETSVEKFQKEYAYGVRYNYGLEGKRQDWSPWSCKSIIASPGANAAAGEHHGCPFRNFDEGQLRATLQQMQVGPAEANFIVDKVKGQHYQVACGKYFEAKHKGTTLIETELGGIMHPNQFFEESAKFYAPKDDAKGAAKDEPAAITEQQPAAVEAGA